MAEPLKLMAVVKNGRFVLDNTETELAEGTVVALVSADVDPYAAYENDDDLDDKERQRLHDELDHSLAQADRGEWGRPIEEVLRNL